MKKDSFAYLFNIWGRSINFSFKTSFIPAVEVLLHWTWKVSHWPFTQSSFSRVFFTSTHFSVPSSAGITLRTPNSVSITCKASQHSPALTLTTYQPVRSSQLEAPFHWTESDLRSDFGLGMPSFSFYNYVPVVFCTSPHNNVYKKTDRGSGRKRKEA